MTEIIRKMFRGELDVLERPYCEESRENTAFSKMEELSEEIRRTLPAQYHSLLEQYKASMMNLMDAACEEEYLAGYQLGVRMMVAAWPENPNKT